MSDPETPAMAPTLFDGAVDAAGDGAPRPPWRPEDHPRIAGRYRLLALIAEGGMGAVYRAHDDELDEVVALKVLRREVVDQPGMLDRFRREVKLARKVTHPNVARTYDIGEYEGEKFITMELIVGTSLAQRLATRRLSHAEAVAVARAVCAGLGAAHQAGVVHRDLKPDNVLLADDGRILITDFGIARAAATSALDTQGIIVGTPTYMAPEQVEGATIDHRADLYALGAMLFELVTGQPPWRGQSSIAVAAQRLTSRAPHPRELAPEVPDALASIVLRLLERHPDDRYATTDEVNDALGRLEPLGTETSATPPVPTSSSSSASSTGVHRTLAVLPFTNRGPAEDAYLVDGLSEDLVDQLSTIAQLRVRPLGMGKRVLDSGGERDAAAIGRELQVQMVLEGSVVRKRAADGDRLRVTTRLINVRDGFQIWARRFEVDPQNVLEASDELAAAVADGLTLPHAPARAGDVDPRAIELYLRARHHFRGFDRDDLDRSVALAEDAHKLAPNDPNFAVLAARVHMRAWFNGRPASAEPAVRLTRRALELAPARAEPHTAMAALELQRGNLASAANELRSALKKNPMLAEAHALVGRLLAEVGPIDRALRSLELAFRLDSTDGTVLGDIARVHILLGDPAGARRVFDQILAIDQPILWAMLGRLIVWMRDKDYAARVLAHPSVANGQQKVASALMQGVLAGARPEDVVAVYTPILRRSDASQRGRVFIGQVMAEAYMTYDAPSDALSAVEESVSHGLIDLMWLEHCPLLQPLLATPRYQELIATVRARGEALRTLLTGL